MADTCAALWLLVVSTWWVAGLLTPRGDVERNASGVVYAVGYFSLFAAEIMLVVVMTRLARSFGGLGIPGLIGPILVGVAVPASAIAAVFVGWGFLVTAGTAVFGAAMVGRRVAPRGPSVAFGFGMSIGAVLLAALRALDESLLVYTGLWGSQWVANLVGITVGVVILSAGLVGLGQWSRRQRAAAAS